MYQAFFDAYTRDALVPVMDVELYPFGGEIEGDGFITVYISTAKVV